MIKWWFSSSEDDTDDEKKELGDWGSEKQSPSWPAGRGAYCCSHPPLPPPSCLDFSIRSKILNSVFRFAYYRQRRLTFCLIHPVLFYWILSLPYLVSHSLTDYCFWILPNFWNWHHATSPCVIFYHSMKLRLNALGQLCLWQCFLWTRGPL